MRKSIFSNILIAFLIVVIPIYIAGFAIYNWAISQLRQEITVSQGTKTRYYLDRRAVYFADFRYQELYKKLFDIYYTLW